MSQETLLKDLLMQVSSLLPPLVYHTIVESYQRSSPGSVPSYRTPGPSWKAPHLCTLRHQEAERQRDSRNGATGECGRPNSSFYNQALHKLRGLSQRDCPGLPGRGRRPDGLREGHGPSSGSRPPQPLRLVPPCASRRPD
ncbi:unnamed protein product [Coccothraustes coccothraustes]